MKMKHLFFKAEHHLFLLENNRSLGYLQCLHEVWLLLIWIDSFSAHDALPCLHELFMLLMCIHVTIVIHHVL